MELSHWKLGTATGAGSSKLRPTAWWARKGAGGITATATAATTNKHTNKQASKQTDKQAFTQTYEQTTNTTTATTIILRA